MTGTFEPNRRAALGMIGATLALPQPVLAGSIETLSGAAFGTHWRITGPNGSRVETLRPEIEALFSEIDLQLSPWRPDSAISQFNVGPAGTTTAVPALIEVTAAALNIARHSEGAFDPTVGPLVARWGFGPIRHGGAPDWRAVSAGPNCVVKARADLTLDLCGIAKGWALDKAVELARAMGLGDLLFELGGEFVALGQHPRGRDWRVGVQSPVPGHLALAALRLPAGMAVATSGTRTQSYVLNGRRYSHIIDPGTRTPVTGGLRSVTVVSRNAMSADGWATALLAAGGVAGPDLAVSEGIAALFLVEEGEAFRQVRTGQIPDLIL